MIVLDLVTLSITLACISAASFVLIFIIWRVNSQVPGTFQWMLGALMVGLAFLSIFLGTLLDLPDYFSPFISNALSMPAVLVTLEGSLRFRGFNSLLRWRLMLLSMPILVLMAWINSENPQARFIFHDAVSALGMLSAGVVLMWKTENTRELLANALAGLTGIMIAMAFMSRWWVVYTGSPGDISGTDIPVNHGLYFALILFSVGWTYGISVACYFRSHQQVMQLAREDVLTGLPNRRSIDEMLSRALADGQRNGGHFAVIVVDINNFKQVNDDFGHSAGDYLLTGIAQRLQQVVRGADFAGRLGGDEFIVVASGIGTDAAVNTFVRRLREQVDGPMEMPGGEFNVRVSAGAAVWPRDDESVDALLGAADARMYRDKAWQQ